jgi:hypothetical protein
LLALAGLLIFFCCFRRKPKTDTSHTAHHTTHSQQDQGPMVEARAESSRDHLSELPAIQSPGMKKVDYYAISSVSPLPHSPSQSPAPAAHSFPFHQEKGSAAPPYEASAFHYQQPVHEMDSAQTPHQMPPQPYSPVSPAASYPHSDQIYAHGRQSSLTASHEVPANPVPKRQVGSIVSTSSIPGPAGDYMVENSALAGSGLPPTQGPPIIADRAELEEHVSRKFESR